VSDYQTKDRWNRTLVFQQHTWDHVTRRLHFDEKGAYLRVMAAFEGATLILDNPPLGDFRWEEAPERQGDERYLGFDPEWNKWVIVPVKILTEPFTRPPGATLPPPVRIALTAWTSPTIPDGNTVLSWQPPKS